MKLTKIRIKNFRSFKDETIHFEDLGKFVQWVYIPAVKDASTEQDESKSNALGVLLARTIRSKVSFDAALRELKSKLETDYKKILETQNAVLTEISSSLPKRLQEWARSGARVNLSWSYDPDKSLTVNEPYATAQVAENGFLGEVRASRPRCPAHVHRISPARVSFG